MRYLADHLTADCSTSRSTSIYGFSLLYQLYYHGSFGIKSCPKTFLSTPLFYENNAVAGIFPFYFFVHGSGMWQRLVHRTRAFKHLHLLVVHCFVCNRTARALLHPLPTEQGLLTERLPQPYSVVCAYYPNLAGIHCRSFCYIKSFRPIRAIQGMECRIGGDSGPGRNGRRPGEPLPIRPW